MTLLLASDHAGFELKSELKKYLTEKGLEFSDLGAHSTESVDYPDFAHALAEQLSGNPEAKGIAICGTGIGISIALNRHRGIRAARCTSLEDARLSREHNDANVLVFGARVTDAETAKQMLEVFLATKFAGGRHEKRVEKIEPFALPTSPH